MRIPRAWQIVRALVGAGLTGLVVVLAILLSRQDHHAPMVTRGGHSLAPTPPALATLSPNP